MSFNFLKDIWALKNFKLGFALFFILVLLLNFSCSQHKAMQENFILELDDIQFFEVEDARSSSGREIIIRGLSMHSSLGVEAINIDVKDDKIEVMVKLAPVKEGIDGNLFYRIPIGDRVNQVLFGSENKIIWERSEP